MQKFLIGLLLMVPLVGYGCTRAVKAVQFEQSCGGYLKRAADANTVEMARRELRTALDYIEANNLTSGYTSVLWRTPDEDVAFWHRNLSAAADELAAVKPDAAQLERTNVLMKLRETLLDAGDKGASQVTIPDGISVFPSNGAYAMFGTLALLLSFVGAVLIVWAIDEY